MVEFRDKQVSGRDRVQRIQHALPLRSQEEAKRDEAPQKSEPVPGKPVNILYGTPWNDYQKELVKNGVRYDQLLDYKQEWLEAQRNPPEPAKTS